ncbi:hypothetical protein KIW84_022159 [Lathyrus oleraceus]|uniref:Protein kinase domain-containing protein n=1 Tax=Pisum sativum TaxID=3888 RepID=A0A9D5BAE2_PEA|nr:hypothetical protein KIW84_022159 [Pisum sativum]
MDSKKQFPCSPPYPFVITDYPSPPPSPPHPTSSHISPSSPPVTSTPPATNIGLISGVIVAGVFILIILLNVCIGAAKGLNYLHPAYPTAVIHRDVKSVNILLDGNINAKVGDFGISITVLIEILCARLVIDPSLPSDTFNLKDWEINYIQKGQSDQIIDPHLIIGDINPDSLKRFKEIAERCVADHGADRPSMRDVLWNLECFLQFQEDVIHGLSVEDHADSIMELATQYAIADFSLTRVFSGLVISDKGM